MSDVTIDEIAKVLPNLDTDSLYLIKNSINQILFERAMAEGVDPAVSIAPDPENPDNIKVELAPELQEMFDKSAKELKEALSKIRKITGNKEV